MKRMIAIFCVVITLLTCSVSATASTEETYVSVPQQAKPGTVLILDDELRPTVVSGGYASKSTVSYLAYACSGMKITYDDRTGNISNIYYPDRNEPSGYSIHNVPVKTNVNSIQSKRQVNSNDVSWTWGSHNNALTYQSQSDSFLGVGRATYFTGVYGNRNNRLKAYDCATNMYYDYSKTGDKDVQIRNLDTNEVFTYHQADVGTLPDAIIDIWGEDNIRELAGTAPGEPTSNADNVRYFHYRFSDQAKPSN